MSIAKNTFISAVGDKQTLSILLEGAIIPIQGPKAVLFTEDNDWYLDERLRFTPLCQRIRSSPQGCNLCLQSDKTLALKAQQNRRVVHAMCPAGLIDIAVPIMVTDQCPAVILCGHIQPWSDEQRTLAKNSLRLLADQLNINYEELISLWNSAKQLSRNDFEDALMRLEKMGAFLSHFVTQRIDAEKNESKLRESEETSRRHIETHEFIFRTLSGVAPLRELYELRSRLPEVLQTVANRYSCLACGVLTTARPGLQNEFILQSYAGPLSPVQNQTYFYDSRHARVQGTARVRVTHFDNDPLLIELSTENSAHVIHKGLTDISGTPVALFMHNTFNCTATKSYNLTVAVDDTPIARRKDLTGFVFFMLWPGSRSGLSESYSEALRHFIQPFTNHLAQLYRNSELFTERRDFMTDMTHQILTPLINAEDTCSLIAQRCDRMTLDQILNRSIQARGLLRHCTMWVKSFFTAATRSDEDGLITTDQLNQTSVRITRMMIEVGSDFRSRARNKNVNIRIEEDIFDIIGVRFLDLDWVRHAVMNIVDNAVKYTPANCADEILLFGKVEKNEFALCVRNTSIRIRPEHRERIFERWFRSPEAEDEEVQGTGLGLAIVKAIVTAHGGRVEVIQEDIVRDGYPTTFYLWFPAGES